MEIKAVIFDMDDLMINSHPAHMRVFEEVLKYWKHSINLQDSLSKKEEAGFFGSKITEVLSFLKEKYDIHAPLEEMNSRFNYLMLPVFEESVEPMPGLYGLIRAVRGAGYRMALASSAKKAKIDIVLKKLKLHGKFDATVSGEDDMIKHGKPAPDIFLAAAGRIDVAPEHCLVLEDSENGVEAAKAGGMYCIGVHNAFAYQRLGLKQDLSRADLEADSLHDVIGYLPRIHTILHD